MAFIWIGITAFLLWLLQGMMYQRFWTKGLRVKLEFSSEAIREGEMGSLREIVENRKLLPIPVLQVGFMVDRSLKFVSSANTSISDQAYRRDIFAVLPYQRITRTLDFQAQKRGYYRCGNLELVGRDLFLEGIYVKKEDSQSAVYVYPKVIASEQTKMICQEMLGEYFCKKKLYEDPFAFQGIRNYEIWDGLKQVNWKASAKTGSLKVNVYENTALPRVLIVLNLEQEKIWEDERLTESVIQIGAALAQQWISKGVPTSVRTNGRDILTGAFANVDYGAGVGHQVSILRMLSRVQVVNIVDRQTREASLWGELQAPMIIYVSAGRQKDNLNALQQYMYYGAGVLWIHPVLAAEDMETEFQIPYVQWRIEL